MAYEKEVLAVQPWLDVELLMGLLQETRLGGQVMEDLDAAWKRWMPLAHASLLTVEGRKYLLVWLDEAVEKEVDEVWQKSASEGFRWNCLAQSMIMGLINDALPEVADAGCAPAPAPSAALAETLTAEGLPYTSGATLSRRFAVLTHYPFKGACDICHLRQECPKAQGRADSFHSVELGGHAPEA